MDRGEEQSRRLRVASASETRPFYVFSHRHGVGSNTNVNIVQTSALRSALGPIKAIRFDYLEGTVKQSNENETYRVRLYALAMLRTRIRIAIQSYLTIKKP